MQKEKNSSKVKVVVVFAMALLLSIIASAQDTTRIDEVAISANRLQNFSTGSKVQNIDSAALAQYATGNLADVLNAESALFIKSYGMGSMAVSSMRGGSAGQTATLWNGFALNNPMYGQLDFSLVPVGFSDAVSIQYGGTGALWGSGAVGGVIHINHRPSFNKGLTIGAKFNAGSFHNFGEQLFVEISKKKVLSSLKVFNNSAQNNFEFYNSSLSKNPKMRQRNAERKSYGLLSESAFKIGDRQTVNIAFWYQFTDRNIPPTLTQLNSADHQKDVSYRATAEWQYKGKKINYFVRSAFFDEALNYDGMLSHSQVSISEAEAKYTLRRTHFFNAGMNSTSAYGMSDGLMKGYSQNKIAAFASYRYQSENEKWTASVSARQEAVNGKAVPFTYSAGVDVKVKKHLSLKSSFSKVYRVPTLNDLYWMPGGNPDLLPESGFSEDAGLVLSLQNKEKVDFRFESSVFNRNIDNWIIWLPGQSYWSPQNKLKVWSRGIETSSKLQVQRSKLKCGISVMTNYVLSTNMQASTEGDASVGRQLIYVPMYSGHAKLSLEFKGFLLSYTHSYTGYRYTASDNTQYLVPYSIANIYCSKNFTFKGNRFSLFAQVDNLFNQQYQVVLSRPMPLRYYNAGLTILLNTKIN